MNPPIKTMLIRNDPMEAMKIGTEFCSHILDGSSDRKMECSIHRNCGSTTIFQSRGKIVGIIIENRDINDPNSPISLTLIDLRGLDQSNE